MNVEYRDWSEADLKDVLKHLGQHLVAIVIAYQCRNEKGELEDQVHYACLTAFVICVGDHWHLMTAGHLIEEWRPAMRNDRPTKIIASSLADCFGIGATRTRLLPFNPFEHPIQHALIGYEDIDYAFIHINESLRSELDGNGIRPLSIREPQPSYDEFYAFGVVGFPEELCVPEADKCDDPEAPTTGLQPVLIPLKHEPLPNPPDRAPSFAADVIDMGDQKTAIGMSGGPIFGFRALADGRNQYEVVAIQSQWGESGRIIGCPVTVALAEARAALKANEEIDDDE